MSRDAHRSVSAALPGTVSSFVGRRRELAELTAAVRRARLVTLVGAGGCGKTRLAVEAARSELFEPAGFVELAAVDDVTLLVVAVLGACGIRDDPGRDPIDRLVDRFTDRTGVLVLDNCEHLRDAVATLVDTLLRRCPALRVLATSRMTLGLPGELVLPIDGVGADAVELFLDRALRAQPALAVDPTTLRRAGAICAMADGLPLAIELAAAHARALSLDEIRTGMADRLHFLTRTGPTDPPRHRSVEASIAWSYRLAGDAAQRVLRALSVLEGPLTLEAAAAVADAPGAGLAARSVIEAVVDQSLLDFDPRDGRYTLLDTIRSFARRELDAAGETAAAHTRLLVWVADLARSAHPGLARGDPAALQRVARDEPAVRTALDHALRTGHGLDVAAEVIEKLAFFWSLRGHCTEGRLWAERIGSRLDPPPCGLSWAAGFLTAYSGDMVTGAQLAQRAADDAAGADQPAVRARALIVVGMVKMFADPTAAQGVLGEAVETARRVGDDWACVEGLQMQAYARLYRAEHAEACLHLDQALPVLTRLGHDQLWAWDAAARAEAAVQAGRFALAESQGRRGLALARAIGEPVSAAGALSPLVQALVQLDRAGEATAVVVEMVPFFGLHPGLADRQVLATARATAAFWGDPGAAMHTVDAAHRLAVESGVAPLAVETALLCGTALLANGDRDGAREVAAEAVRAAGTLGNRGYVAAAVLIGCVADRGAGAPDVSDRAHQALAEAAALALRPLIVDALDVVAGVALDQGRPAVAARLHGATGRIRNELGCRISPLASLFRGDDVRTVEQRLVARRRDAACAEGARLGLEQAVAYATRSRGPRRRPPAGWDSLTPTEREVVALAARGLRNRAIGRQLLITEGTVRTHLRSVFAKLGMTNRSELAAEAARREA